MQFHVVALAAQDPLIVVIHRNGQHTLGLVLADDILVETLFDLGGGHDVDRQIVSRLHPGPPCPAPCRPVAAGAVRFIGEQVVAKADALAADVDTRANDHPFHFVLVFAAEAANQVFFVFIFAGIINRHNRTFLYSLVQRRTITSSTKPYSLACWADIKLSRSVSSCTRSRGWPVYSLSIRLIFSRVATM